MKNRMNSDNNFQKTPEEIFGQGLGIDLTDITILSTPRPLSSSTVQRKIITSTRLPRTMDQLRKPTDQNDTNLFEASADSSLGLVNNISNLLEEHDKSIRDTPRTVINKKIETERELARQILQQCDIIPSDPGANKENNVNIQNLSSTQCEESALPLATSKFGWNSVIFEPTEFTARSSEMRTSENYKQDQDVEVSKGNMNGFSFNSTAAEIMAKFSDADFLPDSRMSSQLSADEMSCRQNFNAIPINGATEKQRLDLSCFSGIMGDVDLTIDSCAGRRVSVGEFFERKCGAMGRISDGAWTERPSFGIEIKSPQRAAKATPLIDVSATTIESSVLDGTMNDDNDIMSLSKIAQALQTVDGTPGRLVDQLLMVNRKQKVEPLNAKNVTGGTYTLSMDKSQPRKLSFSKTLTNSIDSDKPNEDPAVSFDEKKNFTIRNSIESVQDMTVSEGNRMKTQAILSPNVIKQEQKSPLAVNRYKEKIFIGKNTQELYKCIIGVSRPADIEIQNESDRWLKCVAKLHQIQGDENNVEIKIPNDQFLIKPSESHTVKLSVKFLNMGDPIMAAIAFDLMDMTTQETFTKQHMMCFIPEIPNKSASHEDTDKDSVRCDTPQQFLNDCSCPTSPQSYKSSSSVKSGRFSPRSTSSAGTVAGDTVPIKSTHSSLVWTSVRVGKYETREFTIRNTSNNKIKLQGIITDNDNSFKFLKDRESNTMITIVLQHMESKTFTVVFSPNSIGAAAGKITFTHYEKKRENESRPSRIIPLYGYGGYAKVCIGQALKIMGDQMWLSLGKLRSDGTLNTRIQLENTGDLSAYAKITLIPKAIYPMVENNWHIEPTELILAPRAMQWVSIEFRPRKQDIDLIRSDVANMGSLVITYGDEPTRWRIRRLYKKMCEAGQVKKSENQDVFRNVVYPLCKVFAGESTMPHNLNTLRDSLQDLEILCRQVNRQVITLTMEVSGDDTLAMFPDDANESQMFQSLYSDTTVQAANENSYMPPEISTRIDDDITFEREDQITVTPSVINLNPVENEKIISITSRSSTAQPFETTLSNRDYFSVTPSEGMIPARGMIRIKVQCRQRVDKNLDGLVEIYTTNEKRDIVVKVRPG